MNDQHQHHWFPKHQVGLSDPDFLECRRIKPHLKKTLIVNFWFLWNLLLAGSFSEHSILLDSMAQISYYDLKTRAFWLDRQSLQPSPVTAASRGAVTKRTPGKELIIVSWRNECRRKYGQQRWGKRWFNGRPVSSKPVDRSRKIVHMMSSYTYNFIFPYFCGCRQIT